MRILVALTLVLAACSGPTKKTVEPGATEGSDSASETCCCKSFPQTSEDGKLVAYAVQDGGTDWRTVKVLDVASGRIHTDELKWLKFGGGVEWAKDGSGFYYSRFPEPAARRKDR